MAGEKSPIPENDRPENLQDLLKQDRGDDCMPCRVIGGGAFIGLGAYTYWSGHQQLEQQRAIILKSKSMLGMRGRKAGINALAIGLAWMGLWRFFK